MCFTTALLALVLAAPPRTDSGLIEGRILDGSGAPIANADVRLTRLDRDLGPLSYSSTRGTRSAADGGFRFEDVSASTWLLDARDASRYLPYPFRIVVRRDKTSKIEGAVLTLEPAASVEGIVVDEQGRPLAGVGVAVGDGGLQGKNVDPVAVIDYDTGITIKLPPGASYPRLPLRISMTDSEGRFKLAPTLPEVPTSLRVGGLSAYHDTTVAGVFAPAGGTAYVEVTLRRGAAVVGRILLPDGRPAANAAVSLLTLEVQPTADSWIVLPRAAAGSFGVEAKRLITGPEGLFRFEGLDTARYLITSELDGYARCASSMLALTRDGEMMGVEIQLTEGYPIRGRIVDLDERGLAGARVEVAASSDDRSGVEPFLAPLQSDVGPDGRFELRVAERDTVTLRFSMPGLPALMVAGAAPGGEDVVIERAYRELRAVKPDPAVAAGAGRGSRGE